MASSALAGCNGVRPYAAPRVFSWARVACTSELATGGASLPLAVAVERLGERGELVAGHLHPALLQGAEVAVPGTELLDVGVEALLVEEQLVELGDDVGLGEVLADDGDGLVLLRSGRVAAARGRGEQEREGCHGDENPSYRGHPIPPSLSRVRPGEGHWSVSGTTLATGGVRPDGRVDAHGPRGSVRVDGADQPFLARSAIVFSLNLSAVSLVTTIASLSCASAWSSATRLLGSALPSAA